jgi:protein NRD1
MSSAVADLEASLQAMLQLKPPGVSGSRIQSITTLCTANVQVSHAHAHGLPRPHLILTFVSSQSESVLIQKLYRHFKKAPGTHKLGVLYVVDSVTRKWTEQAKSAGQPINNSAQDGTFAAGVNRVKELLPAFMNDITQTAPDDQKVRLHALAQKS